MLVIIGKKIVAKEHRNNYKEILGILNKMHMHKSTLKLKRLTWNNLDTQIIYSIRMNTMNFLL
jgi:hypothetical protein